ncbi:carboxymuconolactone decarboxylase family protein [Derxia gummosa]|uniref:Carboxymuconolactone decarboxylase family protein n=1 Tax=Derxia gummosa DSM 723 TaxID=1121388 RepID=A0A8B6X107_9BURK|nr:carboxymuconolactone decarboxylase family protein [Derxia gummosa]
MSKYYPDITRSQSASLAKLRASLPDVTRGFSTLAQAATRDGVLDKKMKELVVLGMSIAARCDPCIGYHVEALVKLGATRAEVEEVLGLAVYMGGGPSMMYAALALDAYDQYAAIHGGQGQLAA